MSHQELTQSESDFVKNQRVLRFNSMTSSQEIHSVPVCFAFDGKSFYMHARRSNAKRWRNVRKNYAVTLEFDHYSDDWSQLKGVMVYGRAEFIGSGPDHDNGLSMLKEKYRQYKSGDNPLTDSV